MIFETMDIGPSPADEACAQVGSDDYSARARKECRAYINQLIRQHGEPPDGARFAITSNPHDFGTYHDVTIKYDPTDEKAVAFAYKVESDCPANWDDEARKELGLIIEPKEPERWDGMS